MNTFWLSFADDEGHRGCCIVDAPDFLSAVQEAHRLGCNPGGECYGYEIPDIPEGRAEIERWGKGKLVTKAELERAKGYVNLDGEKLS